MTGRRGYLSVNNFWKYQDKNAWKKAKTHPPWFKHYVHRDQDLDRLPVGARLLFQELLGCATRYSNVLEHDLNWIWAETRIEPELIAEMLPLLLKGGWLSQTKSRRRGTGSGANPVPGSDVQDVDVDVEEEKILRVRANGQSHGKTAMFVLRTMVTNGALLDEDQLAVEVRDRRLTDLQHRELLTALRARRQTA